MIYTKEDVKCEMERYFKEDIKGDNRDIIEGVSKKIDTICSQSDVLRACHLIRDSFINITDEKGGLVYKDKKYLPVWIRYLVYVVIYKYLDEHGSYTQLQLIYKMGLKKSFLEKRELEKTYNSEEIKTEITNFYNDSEEEKKDSIITETIVSINKIFKSPDIIDACTIIDKSLVNSRVGIKGNYKIEEPKWLCMIANTVINNYYSQSKLLQEMGLYDDIFGKKNWCMYSPDKKISQAQYESINLPFNHSEIESNDIFRAMIHHMVCYSTVLTDTFVDVFGKLGVIPATCANGYNSRQVWLDENNYKIMCVFLLALEKKGQVCKILKELQYEIKHAVEKVEKENEKGENIKENVVNEEHNVSRLIGLAVGLELNIKNMTKEQVHNNIVNNGSWGFDIYKFAACFIIQQYFASEYWMDSRLNKVYKDKIKSEGSEICDSDFIVNKYQFELLDEKKKKDIKDKKFLSAELVSRVTKQRIEDFVKEDFSKIIDYLYDSYNAKGFSIENIDAITAINTMDDLFCVNELDDTFDLLYVDVPKFIREQERFEFSTEEYLILFDVLTNYKGDWILTWKNYVEISNGYDDSDGWHYKLRTEGKKLPVYEYDPSYYEDEEFNNEVEEKGIDENAERDMFFMYNEMRKLNDIRPLYVFLYRCNDRNHPNNIVFITTINFNKISDSDFKSKYKVSFLYDGKLKKLSFDKFFSNVSRNLSKRNIADTKKTGKDKYNKENSEE